MDQVMTSTFTLPKWMLIPRYLHRAAIPVLIILAGSHLNAPHHSWFLSTVILSVAGVCLFIENPRLSFIRCKSNDVDKSAGSGSSSGSGSSNAGRVSRVTAPPSRRELAFSLIRATTYAFIGDAAAAYLLYDGSLANSNALSNTPHNPLGSTLRVSPTSSPSHSHSNSKLSPSDYLQLGLAASMWALGALLWVMEPPMYWIAWRYQKDYEFDGSISMEEGYDPLDHIHSHSPHPRPQLARSQRAPHFPHLYRDEERSSAQVQPPSYPVSQPQPQSHRLPEKS